jgi:pyruvate,orthophosphate dikinase
MAEKYVYFFQPGKAEGSAKMKDILGGKGAGLAEMSNLGIPVPPGFTISTEACRIFYKNNGQLPEQIEKEIKENLKRLEEITGKKFGDKNNPLLVSVRSGAKFSMPGMMDTILNLGLNDETAEALAKLTGNRRFALDSFRRFLQMFGNVVLGIPKNKFEEILEEIKMLNRIKLDIDLNEEHLEQIIIRYKELIKRETGSDFPQDPYVQLNMAKEAVFKSWNNERAKYYRKQNNIPDDLGTAVNVQAMVFGNMGENSATGVGFTRNPATGEKLFYGEFLPNAQGEDVVAGIRTPYKINELEKILPEAYAQLVEITKKLELHYRDVQDFEFTIEKGKLYMLQTRVGKRTARAAVKIAVDMVKEGLITKEEAIMRIEPNQINQLLHPIIDPKAEREVIGKGLPASPGAAVGKIVFTAEDAIKAATELKEKVILVRLETVPDDIHGMDVSQGILTARGGMTSHAAVVARGMGKPCVVGCEEMKIYEDKKEAHLRGHVLHEFDLITIDGSTGEVMLGGMPLIQPELTGEFGELMQWTDSFKRLGIRANADIPRDAIVAQKFGAQGIGLCRTEHMFFAEDRLPIVQEMILSTTKEARTNALQKLLPFQKEDFKGLFKAMGGYPVTIRLIDPPLHEFLPRREDLLVEIADLKFQLKSATSLEQIDKILLTLHAKEALLARVNELHEMNPMLGHRGCRLVLSYPEIAEMQCRAIFEAACECTLESIKALPEIMIPVVALSQEVETLRKLIESVADETMKKYQTRILYTIGTMIELPRACIVADKIAQYAEFFSFGTNDLTQTTYGFSRDDVNKILPFYIEQHILPGDPFQSIDEEGVGELIKIAVQKGRKVRGDLKIGICGEHGGDPKSIDFCHRAGLNYVSCSPYRVPVARLAAAQAAIREKFKQEVSSST